MSNDDWDKDANAPSFSLIREDIHYDPEKEAEKPGTVDPLVYQRWKKAERRRYNAAKVKQIQERFKKTADDDMDAIAYSLQQLKFIQEESREEDAELTNMIKQLEKMDLARKDKTNETRW